MPSAKKTRKKSRASAAPKPAAKKAGRKKSITAKAKSGAASLAKRVKKLPAGAAKAAKTAKKTTKTATKRARTVGTALQKAGAIIITGAEVVDSVVAASGRAPAKRKKAAGSRSATR